MSIIQKHGPVSEIIQTTLKTAEIYASEEGELYVGIPDSVLDTEGARKNHPLFGHLEVNPLKTNAVLTLGANDELPLNGVIVNDDYAIIKALEVCENETELDLNHVIIDTNGVAVSKAPAPVGLWLRDSSTASQLNRLKSNDILSSISLDTLQYSPGPNEVPIDRVLHAGMRVALVVVTLKNAQISGNAVGAFQTVYNAAWTASSEIAASNGFTSDTQIVTIRSVNAATGTIILDTNVVVSTNAVIALFPVAESLAVKQVRIAVDNVINRPESTFKYIGPLAVATETWNERNRIATFFPQGRYDTTRVYSTHPYRFRNKNQYGFDIVSYDPQNESGEFPWSDSEYDISNPPNFSHGGDDQYFPALRKTGKWTFGQSVIRGSFPIREALKNMTYENICHFIGQTQVPEHEILSTAEQRNPYSYTPREFNFLIRQSYDSWFSVGRIVSILPHQESIPSHTMESGYDFSIAPPSQDQADWSLSDEQLESTGRQTVNGRFRNYVRWGNSFTQPSLSVRQILIVDRDTIQIVLAGRINPENPDPTTNPDIVNYNSGVVNPLPTGALEAVLPAAQDGFELLNTRMYMAETLESQDFLFTPGPYPRTVNSQPWLESVVNVNLQKSKIWHTSFDLPSPGHAVSNIIDWIGYARNYGLQFDTVGQQCLELGKIVTAINPGTSRIDLKPGNYIHLQNSDSASSEYRASRPQDTNNLTIQDCRIFVDHGVDLDQTHGRIVIEVLLNQEIRPIDYSTTNKYFHQQTSPNPLIFSFVDSVPAVTLDEVYSSGSTDRSTVSGRIASRWIDPDLGVCGPALVELDRTTTVSGKMHAQAQDNGVTILKVHPQGLLDLWTREKLVLRQGFIVKEAPVIADPQYGDQRYTYINVAPLELLEIDISRETMYGISLTNTRWDRQPNPEMLRFTELDITTEYNNSSGLSDRPTNQKYSVIQGGGSQIINAELSYADNDNILEIPSNAFFNSTIMISFAASTVHSTTKDNCAINQVKLILTESEWLSGAEWTPVEAPLNEFANWNKVLSALIIPDPNTLPIGTVVRIHKDYNVIQGIEFTALCIKWIQDSVKYIGIPWIREFELNGSPGEVMYGPLKTSTEPLFSIIPLIPSGVSVDMIVTHNGTRNIYEFVGGSDAIETVVYQRITS